MRPTLQTPHSPAFVSALRGRAIDDHLMCFTPKRSLVRTQIQAACDQIIVRSNWRLFAKFDGFLPTEGQIIWICGKLSLWGM
jgi:hypothetical protein